MQTFDFYCVCNEMQTGLEQKGYAVGPTQKYKLGLSLVC